jgi:5,10-methylenetetrahydrofolate reductase
VTSAYAELVELAELELELVQSGQLDELPSIHVRRTELVSSLPEQAPAEAQPSLEAAAAIQAKTEAALERVITQMAAELQAIRRGRHAVQAYTPGSGAESHLVDSTG